ncbi:MAG: TraB domain-containing protein [Candidatus Thorarchaeota archaeon]
MTDDSGRVVFVSVIHTDTESVKRAREVVRTVKPEVVAVELDHERYRQLINPDENMENWIPPPTGDAVQNLMQHMASLEKRLGETTGAAVGTDMLAAIEEGHNVGAKIALVDRPIQATMQAIMKVPLDEIYGLMNFIPEAKKNISDGTETDILSVLKQNGAIDDLMTQFESEFPGLADALIHQRDIYVARALHTILNDVEGKIVIVLGAGHVEGVKSKLADLLEKDQDT